MPHTPECGIGGICMVSFKVFYFNPEVDRASFVCQIIDEVVSQPKLSREISETRLVLSPRSSEVNVVGIAKTSSPLNHLRKNQNSIWRILEFSKGEHTHIRTGIRNGDYQVK